jgi:hypothetical protein
MGCSKMPKLSDIFDSPYFWMALYAALGVFTGVPFVYWCCVAWGRMLHL